VGWVRRKEFTKRQKGNVNSVMHGTAGGDAGDWRGKKS